MTEAIDHVDRSAVVRPGEELDAARLEAYLVPKIPGLAGPLTIEQFPKGFSNLTYLVRGGQRELGSSRRSAALRGEAAELVLRRPPFGAKEIKTAHDMAREHRILSGLAQVYPKVPRPLLLCEDVSVLGAPFYVMERVRGVILRGTRPPKGLELPPQLMRELSGALVDQLAQLHAVDVEAAGLAGEGRPEGYVQRQVEGWTGRYFRAKTDEVQEVEQAAAWLAANMPPERGVCLIHGDFKYDNLVLDPQDLSRIVAILDWEMATVGDPLMDLGTTLGYWLDPDDTMEHKMLPLGPTLLEGNLCRREVVERYARSSGREVPDVLFYYVYGLFKVIVIAQQIYKRFVEGHTKDPRFASMILGVQIMGRTAMRAIERGRIHELG